jgi:hypothetical protein
MSRVVPANRRFRPGAVVYEYNRTGSSYNVFVDNNIVSADVVRVDTDLKVPERCHRVHSSLPSSSVDRTVSQVQTVPTAQHAVSSASEVLHEDADMFDDIDAVPQPVATMPEPRILFTSSGTATTQNSSSSSLKRDRASENPRQARMHEQSQNDGSEEEIDMFDDSFVEKAQQRESDAYDESVVGFQHHANQQFYHAEDAQQVDRQHADRKRRKTAHEIARVSKLVDERSNSKKKT